MAKNTLILVALTIFLFCWFPTFGPGDIITFWLLAKLGLKTYLLYSAVIIFIAYNLIEGKGLSGKFNTIKQELKQILG